MIISFKRVYDVFLVCILLEMLQISLNLMFVVVVVVVVVLIELELSEKTAVKPDSNVHFFGYSVKNFKHFFRAEI